MMNPLIGPETFLTSWEQTTLAKTPIDLRREIEQRLLVTMNKDDIECAQLILTVFNPDSSSELKRAQEIFFLELLKIDSSKRLKALSKLYKICQKQGFEGFFQCVISKKVGYYPKEVLLEVIEVFTKVAEKNHDLLPLSNIPCYDEGGKGWLKQLEENPDLSTFTFGRSGEPSSSRLLLPPIRQSEDVFSKGTSFQKTKALAIRYLTSLPETHRSSIDTYQKIFRGLQNDTKFPHLSEFSKIELTKLILLTTTRKDHPVSQKFSQGDFDELLEEAHATVKSWGVEFLITFTEAPDIPKNPSLDGVIRALKLSNLLAKNYQLFASVIERLQHFGSGKSTLETFVTSLEELAPEVLPTLPNEEENLELLQKRMRGDDPNVAFRLPSEHLTTIERQYAKIEEYCDSFKHLRMGQLVELASKLRAQETEIGFSEDIILQLIAVGRLAAFIKFQIYARSTQIYTILGELCFEKGAMAQVKTGEGKSLIITLLGFVLSMQNKSVHIISSDRTLAKRDQRKAVFFFDPFGISTSNICKDNAKAKRFQAQILYGTASDFEFAVMRELLDFTPLFEQKMTPIGEKRFDCVIIDELDNLTIDTASNQARLSARKEETHEWVYFPIFTHVRDNFNKGGFDLVSTTSSVHKLREFLEGYSHGTFKDRIHHLADEQLETWLISAFKALYQLSEYRDYVVRPKPKKEMGDNDKVVVIVDAENTGRLMWGSRWSNGLHEFVEVKHSMIPQRESLCPITLSHPVFYQMYRSLYGLSGTLGSPFEREEIKDIYDIPSFDIPTFRPLIRKDLSPVIVPTQEAYFQKMQKIVAECRKQQRPILVLCKTIQDSQNIGSYLKKAGIPFELLNELQEKSEEEILENAGCPGAVTVATNTAGRGTDIILKGESEKNGGLHVLITFYPDSKRVEDQARGRAGRQGQKGSSEILISRESLENIPPNLTDLEILNFLEVQRTSRTKMMKQIHLLQSETERHVFGYVRQFYELFGKFEDLLNNETFLESAASALSKRKIQSKTIDLENLKLQDRKIADEALKLLIDSEQDVVKWKTLLQQTGKRIQSHVLNLWALDFHHNVDELLKQSRAQSMMNLNFRLRTADLVEDGHPLALLFSGLEEALIQDEKKRLAILKQEITDQFAQKREDWEKPLHPSGNGILDYLRKNTQTVLRGVESTITR